MALARVDVSFRGFDSSPQPEPAIRQRILLHLADMCMTIMLRRIQTGKNVDGSPFKVYKPKYAAWKAIHGRKANTGKDWLHLTGQMLGNLDVIEYSPDHFVIGFSQIEQAIKAWVNQSVYKRVFIGLTLAERREAIDNTVAHARAEGWL